MTAATTGTQAKGSWAQRCRARWSAGTSLDAEKQGWHDKIAGTYVLKTA